MLTTLNIGSGHNRFNHSIAPNFTQVLVLDENHEVVAQFYGVFAKRLAGIFVQKFNEFSPKKIDQPSIEVIVDPFLEKEERMKI